MLKYLARRLSATFLVITLVSMSVFGIFAVLPMDPAALTCGKACSPAVIEANRHRLGLDVPAHVQYINTIERSYPKHSFLLFFGSL